MVDEQPTPDEAGLTPVAAPVAPRVRWQDRVLRRRSVIAVALATLIVGGFAGAGFGAWIHHDHGRFDGRGRMGHMGEGMRPEHGGMMRGPDGDSRGWGPPGWGAGGPGGPGQGSPQMMPGWGQNGGQNGQTAPPPTPPPSQNG